MRKNTEKNLINLIAADRMYIAISSMNGILSRQRPELAKKLGLVPGESFDGKRVYAEVRTDGTSKARGMRKGIEKFKKQYPQHGKILEGYIQEKRTQSETNVYFGVKSGCRLTQDDYIRVMQSLGFTDSDVRNLYPALIDVSRRISRYRNNKERSVLLK